MKTILAIIMSLALATLPLRAQSTTTNTPPAQPDSMMICLIVLTALVVGGAIVIYVNSLGNCSAKHKLVLLANYYDGNWIPVATNCVMVSTNKMAVFSDLMTNSECLYKVQDCGFCQ